MPLISRNKMPPGGWQYFSPQTGWKNPTPTNSSFRDTVNKIVQHNRNNPRFNLTTDPDIVASLLEDFTCKRLNQDPAWCYGPIGPAPVAEAKKKRSPRGALARLAADAELIANGAAAITEWLAKGGNPVPKHVAEKRAAICATCPKNQSSNAILAAAAWVILKTAKHIDPLPEPKLGECAVCNCQLDLKVWFPFFDIDGNTNPKLWDEFPDECWAKQDHKRLTVVIPFYSGDHGLTIKLLDWMIALGGEHNNRCLLVKDTDVTAGMSRSVEVRAKMVFAEVEIIEAEPGVQGWPGGPNRMFQSAIDWIETQSTSPFIWLEPDAIPLKQGWLQQLEAEYWKSGKLFMGHIVTSENKNDQWMTGVAVYPHDSSTRMSKFIGKIDSKGNHIAWDYVSGKEIAAQAHFTTLLQHTYTGRKRPISFSEQQFSLADIAPDAVLFHQCKDGSLLELLRRNLKLT